MKMTSQLMGVCAALLVAVTPGFGQQNAGETPVIYEPFDYVAGSTLTGQMNQFTSNIWQNAQGTGVPVTIGQGNLTLPELEEGFGNSVQLHTQVGQAGPICHLPFGAIVTSNEVHFSALVKVVDISELTGFGFRLFGLRSDAQSGSAMRILIRAADGGYNIGVAKDSGSQIPRAWHDEVLLQDETVLIMGSYTVVEGASNDVAKVWVLREGSSKFEESSPAPSIISAEGPDAPNVSDFAIWQYAMADTNSPWLEIDRVTITRFLRLLDFGDAPDPDYATMSGSDGARHYVPLYPLLLTTTPFYLGAKVDWEANAHLGMGADGDDTLDGNDDEDGVSWSGTGFVEHDLTEIQVVASRAGHLDAWIDYNTDGDWTDAGEQIFTSESLVGGTNKLTFTVGSVPQFGVLTYARFRFSKNGGLAPTGYASTGEVEDYRVSIVPEDFPFAGLHHRTFGNVVMSQGPNGLEITGLDGLGEGVQIDLGQAEGWSADLVEWDTLGTLNIAILGNFGVQSNQPICSVQLAQSGSDLALLPDFSALGTTQYQAEYYDPSGILVGTSVHTNDSQPEFVRPCVDQNGNWGTATCHIRVFADSIYIVVCGECITLPGSGGDLPTGGTIKLSPISATATADFVSTVEITGHGTTSLTISDEAVLQSGLWHRALGEAQFQGSGVEPDGAIELSNLTVGQDGLATELDGTDALDVDLDPLELRDAGSSLQVIAEGQLANGDGFMGSIVMIGTGNGTDMAINLDPSGTWHFDAWDHLQHVANNLPQNSGEGANLAPIRNGSLSLQYFGAFQDDDGRLAIELEFEQPMVVTPTGGTSVRATRIRCTADATIADLNLVSQLWDGPGSVRLFFRRRDFGDAPSGYPVTRAEKGARHRRSPNWKLGDRWDRERNGHHSANVDYDDTHRRPDEDGVFVTSPTPTGTIHVDVVAGRRGYLDAWVDFDRDLDWDEPYDQIFTNEWLVAGTNRLSITVPCGMIDGDFVSRWRFSATGGLTPKGYGGKGEVEDHIIRNWSADGEGCSLDYGDAPDDGTNYYPTLKIRNGARHEIPSAFYLGSVVPDEEHDGLPSWDALLDDTTTSDDEDGVVFTSALEAGSLATVDVTCSTTGRLDAWIDFDEDYDFHTTSDEKIFDDEPVSAGVNSLSFPVPSWSSSGGKYARFRFSSAGGLDPTGIASDGEVEDYGPGTVIIVPGTNTTEELDFGDAPDDGINYNYQTLGVSDGARHERSPVSLMFGDEKDYEPDGIPTIGADGDDNNAPVNDEDGITGGVTGSVIVPGTTLSHNITINGSPLFPAYVDAWLDMNRNGVFDHPSEKIHDSVLVSPGVHTMTYVLPSTAALGDTYARFRVSVSGGLLPHGLANSGEVQDYHVTIGTNTPTELDYGDAPDDGSTYFFDTLLASHASDGGARHAYSGLVLGTNWDAEPDGQPSIGALLDDTTGTPDDEDGVDESGLWAVFDPDPAVTDYVKVYVTGGPGLLDAWIDWNGDHRWDSVEHVIAGAPVSSGWNYIMVTTPGVTNGPRYARFRLSTAGTPDWYGYAADGEVEDYVVEIRLGAGGDDPPGGNPNPRLQIERFGGDFRITWDAVGVILEQSDTPNGPWMPVAEATSPYTLVPSAPQKFFRLAGSN